MGHIRRVKSCILLLCLMIAFLCGCSKQTEKTDRMRSGSEENLPHSSGQAQDLFFSQASSPPVSEVSPSGQAEAASSGGKEDGSAMQPHPYLKKLVSDIVKEITTPAMSEYEKTKAAFDYMITHVSMEEPIGLDLWRIYGGGEEPIPFVEQRAISPLRFGVGMCEDYAAALTLVLRGMGLAAEYVPGLTYSAEGHLVDHAWTMVQIDGVWYHLDCQLEDNISRRGAVRYKYFLRGDATLSGSHRWGQNLIDSRLLTEEQNEEIRENYLTPAAPQDYPTPERLTIGETPAPDLAALQKEAAAELAAWETENGPLPEMELNTIPPVFGLTGYGPADEG